MIRAMTTEMFLNLLDIRMNSRPAEGLAFTVNIIAPDNRDAFILELANAALTNVEGFLAAAPKARLATRLTAMRRGPALSAALGVLVGASAVRIC